MAKFTVVPHDALQRSAERLRLLMERAKAQCCPWVAKQSRLSQPTARNCKRARESGWSGSGRSFSRAQAPAGLRATRSPRIA